MTAIRVRRVSGRRRSGNVLVLFGLFAMAALVIDVGFARLTQRQMQTAVDSAARERLRFRDVEKDEPRCTHAKDLVGKKIGSVNYPS